MLVDASGEGAIAVTPSDTVDLVLPVPASKGIYVGVSGNVKVKMANGTTPTFTNLAAGMIHPLSVNRVYATGTTATGIFAVY